MARLDFGSTWWGKKWLDALIATDYSNRLPRGMRYARNGSVRNLSVHGTTIKASVQGSQPRPYAVSITIPPLSATHRKKILSLIEEHPFILAQLKQKKLPQELYDVFLKKHIHLFPRQWDELKADCSCPDWADCCKHIAAVIYLIANEIDQNPFRVLLLRGFDVLKELKTMQIGQEEAPDHAVIRKTKDIIDRNLVKTAHVPASVADAIDILGTIDFSHIPDLGDDIVSIFPEQQVFCREQDLKQLLQRVYASMARQRGGGDIGDTEETEAQEMRLASVFVSNRLTIDELTVHHDEQSLRIDRMDDRAYFLFELSMRSIPLSALPYLDAGMRSVVLAHKLATVLAERGAMVPELLEVTPTQFCIRFVPFVANGDVKRTLETASALMPTAQMRQGCRASHTHLSRQETCTALVSFFLGRMVRRASNAITVQSHPVLRSLLLGEDLTIGGIVTRDTVELVALYLSRFSIACPSGTPAVVIDEAERDGEFSLSLGLRKIDTNDDVLSMRTILTQESHAKHRVELLHVFGLLAEYCPEIASALLSKTVSVDIREDRCIELLRKTLPILRILSIHTLLPRSLGNLLSPRATVAVRKSDYTAITSYLSLANMLRFDWRVAVGDRIITEDEMRSLLAQGRKLVKFRGTYVVLDPKEAEALLRGLERPPQITAPALMLATLLGGEWHGAPISIDKNLVKEIRELFRERPVTVPKNLRAELRPYQERGFAWLYRNHRINFGSLLADDMGLGKTLQVITLLLKLKEEHALKNGGALVVAPTTLLTNWQKEIEKFAPTLRVQVYHGQDRSLPRGGFDVILTSYGLVRRDSVSFEQREWAVCVFDEAQNVKNPATAQSKAMKRLRSNFRIAMTGTPVENSLMEYWNIADTVHPGYLGSAKAFRTDIALPIQREQDANVLRTFHAITKPLIMRRVKTDTSIISDLPKKVEQDTFTTLTKEQASLYQSVVESIMENIESSEGIARKGLVFKLMTSLKQICNHPSHYRKSPTFTREQSGKAEHLFTLLETVRANHDKVLIFTQYTEMGTILHKLILEHYARSPLFFHGGLSRRERDTLVESFQNDPLSDVMILSLKAGGVGLNLTAASHVIHYDLWWNPAVETQATDRAYRIGQKKNVFVHRFITQGTFEEKIDAMIKRKKSLANLTVATGEKWIGELSNSELREIVRLERM